MIASIPTDIRIRPADPRHPYPELTLGEITPMALEPLWHHAPGMLPDLGKFEQEVFADSPARLLWEARQGEGMPWGMYARFSSDETPRLVGVSGLLDMKPGAVPEAVRYIMDPEARGKHLGTLALLGMADHAFGPDYYKGAINITTQASNRGALRSQQKAGFVHRVTEGNVVRSMLFSPEGPDYPDEYFSGIDKTAIERSRGAYTQQRAQVHIDRRKR